VEEMDNAGNGNDTITDSSHSDIMGVATPQHITYHTPSPEDNYDALAAEQLHNEAILSNSTRHTLFAENNADFLSGTVEYIEGASSPGGAYHTQLAESNGYPLSRPLEMRDELSAPSSISSPHGTPYTPLQERESIYFLTPELICEEESDTQLRSVDLPPLQTFHSAASVQLAPPTIFEQEYEDNMASPEGVLPNTIKNKAESHRERGEFAEAASEYLRLVDVFVQEKGQGSVEVFETFAELADIYQAEGKLPESIEAYRRVVSGYKGIFGASSLETLRTIHNLGKVLEEDDLYEEAETCYRQAITGFEELGTSGFLDRLDCQGFLGDLLSDTGRDEEALQLFIPLLASYNELGLHHRKISILGSLLEVYNGLENSQKLHATIQDLHKLLDERIDIDYRSIPEVLWEGIHLGSIYGQLLEYELADSLLSQVIPKLELLDDVKYKIEKLYGYMEYGNVKLRLNCLEQAERCLSLAKVTLENCNRHDDPVAAFVDSRVLVLEFRSAKPIQRNTMELSKQKLREFMKKMGDQGNFRDMDEESRTGGEVATNTDASSCKYGVSFSETDITGISHSEFYTG
jgi:tetratricopeptide (TPR) repeat protein